MWSFKSTGKLQRCHGKAFQYIGLSDMRKKKLNFKRTGLKRDQAKASIKHVRCVALYAKIILNYKECNCSLQQYTK